MNEDLRDNQENVLEDAVEQFVDAQLQGLEPVIDEFVRKYPGLEHQVRKRIRKLQKINTLFSSLVNPDESDFEDAGIGPDLVGRKIRNFDITEMVGRGGMGVVYLAHDTKLKRSVAIKSMPTQLTDDSTARTRFKREAELLASLNHPNIAVIYEIIEEEKSGYLVLEYVPGETLSERIAHGPLTMNEALSIGKQVAEAVSAAHKKGIVHRDLKPGNVKNTPDGQVKVLDFGLAKSYTGKAENGETTITKRYRIMGTPAYMSPEQTRGKDTDYRTDIWSFGCIMYQMLTGQLPFEGQTATDTLARIIEREPDWSLLPQETPANIRTLLRHCLEKDPDLRLGDIADAAIEISETLGKAQTVPAAKRQWIAMIVGAVCIIVSSSVVVWFALTKQAQPSSREIRLVVLPFENLGSSEDEYFADGLSEEIMSRLSAIHSLAVISRTSTIQYKSTNKTIEDIGEELSVEYALEGTIRWDRSLEGLDRVRVTPRLIRISDNTQLWSERYDAVLSDIFQVQSDIGEKVTHALDITLLEPERQTLTLKPTENMEAYDYYLKGNESYYRSLFVKPIRIAIDMYEKAIKADPTFALAYARLSRAHLRMYWWYDYSETRLDQARRAVITASELDPDLSEVHEAWGWYYYHGHLDYERALEHFAMAQMKGANSEVLLGIAYIQRRQGKNEQALANFKKAYELDPLYYIPALAIGETLLNMRRYAEVEPYLERAILLAPDQPMAYQRKSWLYLRQGDVDRARAIVKEALQNMKQPDLLYGLHRDLVFMDMCDRDYEGALERLARIPEDEDSMAFFTPRDLERANIFECVGKKELARKQYESALSVIQAKIKEEPENDRSHRYYSSLGLAYAGLGLKQEAIDAGLRGVELMPLAKDALGGMLRIEDLARIYAVVGEFDKAIDRIESLLQMPSGLSISLLRLDPAWDSLRNHPRFKKLVETKK